MTAYARSLPVDQWQRIKRENAYDSTIVRKNAELFGAMTIVVLGSLEILTTFPWSSEHLAANHTYPSKSALRASIRAAMLEDAPELLFNVLFFVLMGKLTLMPVISCCVTVLQLLWTVFTKLTIIEEFEHNRVSPDSEG